MVPLILSGAGLERRYPLSLALRCGFGVRESYLRGHTMPSKIINGVELNGLAKTLIA
jgi:hypothetical protein